MKELIHNQAGYGSIILLIVMPLLLVMLIGNVELTRIAHGSNIDVKKAVEQGVKAAVLCVNEQSQANGTPYIEHDRALSQFKRIMTTNLSLAPDWTPLPDSGVLQVIEYQLLVINGDNAYEPSATIFINSETGSDLSYLGLPKLNEGNVFVGIDENGLIINGSGTFDSDIKTPSCIGWVKIKLKNVVTTTDEVTVRWGVGRIINNNGY